jgi:L-seryl-tRNA(Ser) seleniumtransferase
MLLFLNKARNLGQVGMNEFVTLGRQRGIPTMNDCAADVPPMENLLEPIRSGFDLVVVSGGKGIRGPQSAGILAGRADLIRAARKNTSPNSDTIGRSCKVNKEELVGMMVALESCLREDHRALYRAWQQTADRVQQALSRINGATAQVFVPDIANQCPHVRLSWDKSQYAISPESLLQNLRDGEPSIELVPAASVPGTVEIASWTLQPAEDVIITRRIAEVLRGSR